MKNILVLVHDDPGQDSRLQAALDVTRALAGHLRCVDVRVPPDAHPEIRIAVGPGLLVEKETQREVTHGDRIRARLEREDVSWDLVEMVGDIEPALQSQARLADLIVVTSDVGAMDYDQFLKVAGDLILETRKPVLAVPQDARSFDAAGRALIAWDGSREAAAALSAAVPLLAIAEGVTILEVDQSADKVSAEEAAAYLSRHGVHSRISRRSSVGGIVETALGLDGVAETLLKEAKNCQSAYIVMGGYGHSQLREWMFGGVTRTLLATSPFPLLIAH